MISTQHVKLAVIGGLLLLSTIALGITEDSQRLVIAQITPAPEKAGSSDESSQNDSQDTGGGNGNVHNNEGSASLSPGSNDVDDHSHGTSSSDEATEEDSTETLDSYSDNNSQGITPSEKTDGNTEEPIDLTDSSDVNNGGQTITDQEDEAITTEEQNFDPTSQLVESIMNEVDEALSASGITIP